MANKREVAASFAGKQRVSQAQIYQLVKAGDVTAIVVVVVGRATTWLKL